MSKEVTPEQLQELDEVMVRARKAAAVIAEYDQEKVDRLCRAVAWAVGNKKTWDALAYEAVEETGLGDPVSKCGKVNKLKGVLRDALRGKSVGVIEEDKVKGITKYAKPVGVIASLVPTTNPCITPAGQSVYAIKARDVVVFSPHPRAKNVTKKTIDLMRAALERKGRRPISSSAFLSRPSLFPRSS